MSQLTQAQVIAYNKKVTAAKEKASQDKARKELAEKELARTCEELSDLLGKTITPENLEAEYESFVSEALKTMDSGTKILDGIENEQAEALNRGVTSNTSTPAASNPVSAVADTTVTEKKDDALDLDDLLGL